MIEGPGATREKRASEFPGLSCFGNFRSIMVIVFAPKGVVILQKYTPLEFPPAFHVTS